MDEQTNGAKILYGLVERYTAGDNLFDITLDYGIRREEWVEEILMASFPARFAEFVNKREDALRNRLHGGGRMRKLVEHGPARSVQKMPKGKWLPNDPKFHRVKNAYLDGHMTLEQIAEEFDVPSADYVLKSAFGVEHLVKMRMQRNEARQKHKEKRLRKIKEEQKRQKEMREKRLASPIPSRAVEE